MTSERQQALHQAATEIDTALSLDSAHSSIVGAWSDGAENSVLSEVKNPSWDQLRLSGAMKGYLADQKSVLLFKQDDKGEAVLYKWAIPGTLESAHKGLSEAGIEHHTLQRQGSDVIAYVVDLDGSLHDKIAKASGESDVEYQLGRAEFIGTTKEDGTDREQRDDARRAYAEIVEQSPVQNGAEVWDRIRNRWGETLTPLQDFNPYHAPAGSSEGGQFTSAEGAGAGGESASAGRFVSALGAGIKLSNAKEYLKSRTAVQVLRDVAENDVTRNALSAGIESALGYIIGLDPSTSALNVEAIDMAIANFATTIDAAKGEARRMMERGVRGLVEDRLKQVEEANRAWASAQGGMALAHDATDPVLEALQRLLDYLEKTRDVTDYDPDQPREPAGSSEGGRWVSAGGGIESLTGGVGGGVEAFTGALRSRLILQWSRSVAMLGIGRQQYGLNANTRT